MGVCVFKSIRGTVLNQARVPGDQGSRSMKASETHQISTETPSCSLFLNQPMQVYPGSPLAALGKGSESLHESHPRGC